MKIAWDFNRAVQILKEEIELLKKISEAEKNVRKAVIDREWTYFEEKTQESDRLSVEFTSLDEERAALFSCLSDNSSPETEKPFTSLIANLNDNEQKDLSCLYRELKMETHKMKALNETFLAYLNEAKTLATAYISTVCPDRGGKLYTSKGRTVTPDLRSIVINNRF